MQQAPGQRGTGAQATTIQTHPVITNAAFNTILSLKGIQAPAPVPDQTSVAAAERKKVIASIAAGGEQINVHAHDQA